MAQQQEEHQHGYAPIWSTDSLFFQPAANYKKIFNQSDNPPQIYFFQTPHEKSLKQCETSIKTNVYEIVERVLEVGKQMSKVEKSQRRKQRSKKPKRLIFRLPEGQQPQVILGQLFEGLQQQQKKACYITSENTSVCIPRCQFCNKLFLNKQGLGGHLRVCRKQIKKMWKIKPD